MTCVSTFRRAVLAAALLCSAALSSARAEGPLDALLAQTKQAQLREAELDAQRETEFRARREEQARLLAMARQRRDAAEARSQALSARYDENERRIRELEGTLRERAGNLGELFGVTRQVAGDSATVFQQSLISAQFPEREAFARRLAAAKELPSIEELERLWYELQLEMTESGRVARSTLTIVEPDGQSREAEVVRIGPFSAYAEGRSLAYLASQQKLAVLPRALPARFARTAEALGAARSGVVRAAVDPSRGVLAALYVERPTWIERIEEGEAVGYLILFVGALGAAAALYQLGYLMRVRIAVRRQLERPAAPTSDNPLGRVLLAFKGDGKRIEELSEVAELRISEAVLREVPRLERFQSFLRLVVAAGPLLGLVGTVIGMIITFQSITESGSSDPRLMATGIGQAMIATVLGLGIAIPLLFANAALASLSRQVVQVLDEQSAGLLAETLEEQTHAGA